MATLIWWQSTIHSIPRHWRHLCYLYLSGQWLLRGRVGYDLAACFKPRLLTNTKGIYVLEGSPLLMKNIIIKRQMKNCVSCQTWFWPLPCVLYCNLPLGCPQKCVWVWRHLHHRQVFWRTRWSGLSSSLGRHHRSLSNLITRLSLRTTCYTYSATATATEMRPLSNRINFLNDIISSNY